MYLALKSQVYYTTNKRLRGLFAVPSFIPGVYAGPGVESRKYGALKCYGYLSAQIKT